MYCLVYYKKHFYWMTNDLHVRIISYYLHLYIYYSSVYGSLQEILHFKDKKGAEVTEEVVKNEDAGTVTYTVHGALGEQIIFKDTNKVCAHLWELYIVVYYSGNFYYYFNFSSAWEDVMQICVHYGHWCSSHNALNSVENMLRLT